MAIAPPTTLPALRPTRVMRSWGALAVLLVTMLAVNWVTIDRSPRPWLDEVLFADPGFNLAEGIGFTSGWWPGQPRGEAFAGNAPLYSLLVAGWASAFGSSLAALRLLNAILLAFAALLLIGGLRRLGLLTTWRSELLLAFLLYGGYAMTFVYRSARYDVLGLLLCAGLFAAITLPRRADSRALIVVIAALLPVTGLQLIPFVAAACGLRLTFDPDLRRAMTDGLLVAAGMSVGGLILLAYLSYFGVVDRLFVSLSEFSDRSGGVVGNAKAVASAVLSDPSSLLALAGLSVAALVPATASVVGRRCVIVIAAFGLALPAFMAIVGRFPIYYAWMKFIPLAIVIAVVIDRLWRSGEHRSVMAMGMLCLIIGFGFPGRHFLAYKYWSANDPDQLRAAVHSWIVPGEVVYATPLAYFAAREVTPHIFGPSYYWWGGEWLDEVVVDVILVAPDEATKTMDRFGGEWDLVDRFDPSGMPLREDADIGRSFHSIVAYRRVVTSTQRNTQ